MLTLAAALLPTHLIPASAGLLMATLALGAVLALMVSWALLAHLVPVLAGQLMFVLSSAVNLVPALTIRPAATSALAAVSSCWP